MNNVMKIYLKEYSKLISIKSFNQGAKVSRPNGLKRHNVIK